jgi:glutamate dehydrogenase
VMELLRQETLWFLRNADVTQGLSGLVERHQAGVMALRTLLATTLPAALSEQVAARAADLVTKGVPEETARAFAELGVLGYASDIVLVSERSGVPVADAATAFFGLFTTFALWPVIELGRAIVLSDRFDRMALDRALANLMRGLRDLTADVLKADDGPVDERLANWRGQRKTGIERTAEAVAELTRGTLTVSRLSVAAGLLADLAREG